MQYNILLLFMLALFSSASLASSVWKVSSDTGHVYLGGTMHLLSESDYPLPLSFETAYKNADTLVFETDISAMSKPEFQQKSMQLLTYTNGTVLDDVLAPSTVLKLQEHLKTRSVSYENIKHFKASLLTITLSMIEYKAMGLTAPGVDAFYFSKSLNDGKTQSWLESPDEQLRFISQMATGEEDDIILYTLDELASLPKQTNALKQAWRSGDTDALRTLGLDSWAQEYPDLFYSIMVARNNNWLPSISEMLATAEIEFVLVGALHMVGEKGLLEQLKKQGFKVEQL